MKLFKQKSIVQKIIILIVIIILSNFILPNVCSADNNSKNKKDEFGGVLFAPIQAFILGLGDAAMFVFNQLVGMGGDNMLYISKDYDYYDGLDKFLPFMFAAFTGPIIQYNLFAKITGGNSVADNIHENVFGGDALPDTLGIPMFWVTPESIFSNSIPFLDVNIISPSTDKYNTEDNADNTNTSVVASVRSSVSSWYNGLRNLALVAMLSMLVYIGIRIIISSTAAQKSKYKEMIKDWIVGIFILFFMHYIMSFSMVIVEQLSLALDSGVPYQELKIDISGYKNHINDNVKDAIETTGGKIDGNTMHVYTEFTGLARFKAQVNSVKMQSVTDSAADTEKVQMTYTLIYGLLVIYTGMFLWQYVKRLIYIIFLTLVAPIVAATYPIDKLSDNKAQAFNLWLKEYIFTLIIQPLHLLIYVVLVGPAKELASQYMIYPLVVLGFMLQAEKIMKKFFNFSRAEGPGYMGGIVGGAAVMSAMGAVTRGLAAGKKQDKSKQPKIGDSIRTKISNAASSRSNTSGEDLNDMLSNGTAPALGGGALGGGMPGDSEPGTPGTPGGPDANGQGYGTYGDESDFFDNGNGYGGVGDSGFDPTLGSDIDDDFGQLDFGFGKFYDDDGFETLSDDEQAEYDSLNKKLAEFEANGGDYDTAPDDIKNDRIRFEELSEQKALLERQKQQELDRREQLRQAREQEEQRRAQQQRTNVRLDLPPEEPAVEEEQQDVHAEARAFTGARTTPEHSWFNAAAPIAGRAALKLGEGVAKAYGAAALATVGGLAGLASDKYENVAAFGLAGAAGGWKAMDGVINKASNLPSDMYNKSQEIRDEYYKNYYKDDPEGYKDFLNKEADKAFKRDKEAMRKYRSAFGKDYQSAMEDAMKYRNHGVTNDDLIIKAMKAKVDGVSSDRADKKRIAATMAKKINNDRDIEAHMRSVRRSTGRDENDPRLKQHEDLIRKIWL